MAKKKKATKKSVQEVPFESSLENLRQVVSELENGNLSLSDSLDKYEQGVANLKSCYEALNQAQRKIELLVDLDEEGNLVTRPFDNTSSEQMTGGSPRRAPVQTAEFEEEVDEDSEEIDEEFEEDDPNSLF